MKQTLLFVALSFSAMSLKAQSPLSYGAMNGAYTAFNHFSQAGDSSAHQKKWFVTKYAGISTGFMAFSGGSGSFLSAPVGLQINRQLTNNVIAFAGVSAVPTFFTTNSAFDQPGLARSNGFMNGNNFGTYSAAHLGLMYINNDRTFSISGSFGVSRSNYNQFAPLQGQGKTPTIRNSHQ